MTNFLFYVVILGVTNTVQPGKPFPTNVNGIAITRRVDSIIQSPLIGIVGPDGQVRPIGDLNRIVGTLNNDTIVQPKIDQSVKAAGIINSTNKTKDK